MSTFEDSFGWLTNWSVYATVAYLFFSIQASNSINSSLHIENKAMANLFGSIALNLDIIIFSATFFLHPFIWYLWGWTTLMDIFWQVNTVAKHQIPMMCAAINFFILSDSVIYFTDVWAVLLVYVSYLIFSNILYRNTGFFVYYTNWGNDLWWTTPISFSFLGFLTIML